MGARQPGFVPAMVVEESGPPPWPANSGGSIEIQFAVGARMRITGTVDAATLKAARTEPPTTTGSKKAAARNTTKGTTRNTKAATDATARKTAKKR